MFNTSPCKFIDYTDQSIQIALATMCGIGAFILMLSIVSKQLERRSNLSHFDEVFDAHHERDDVEAQLQAANTATNGEEPRDAQQPGQRMSTFGPPAGGGISSIAMCATAGTFAVNLHPSLGSDDHDDLPNIRDLCSMDLVIVDSNVKIVSLVHDCDNMCREHDVEAARLSMSSSSSSSSSSSVPQHSPKKKFKRPRFLCYVEFDALLQSTHVSNLLHKGFDGIVVRGVSVALQRLATKFAQPGVESKTSRQILDETLSQTLEVTSSLDKPLIVEVSRDVQVDLDFNMVNGILFRNPTMREDGTPHHVWGEEHDRLENFLLRLKRHVSMSVEFTLLAINVVDQVDSVLPEQVVRFNGLTWARSLPMLCRTCADVDLRDKRETMLPMDSGSIVSPTFVARTEAMRRMMRETDQLVQRKKTREIVKLIRKGGRGGGGGEKQVTALESNDVDMMFLSFGDVSLQVSKLIEKTMSGSPVDASFWEDDVARPDGFPLGAPLGAASRGSAPRGTTLEGIEFLHLVSENEEDREREEESAWFQTSTPVATRGGRVEDPGGQKLVGQTIDGPEYTSIVGRLIAQRQTPHKNGCLLQNLSAPSLREQYSGDERQNNVMNVFDDRFTKLEKRLREIMLYLRTHERNKTMAIVERSRRAREGGSGAGSGVAKRPSVRYTEEVDEILRALPQFNVRRMLKILVERMHEIVLDVDGTQARRVQLWLAYPRSMNTNVSGTTKRFYGIQQSAGEVTHMYFSLDHPDLLEGVLHCYFQSLGCRHQQCVAAELLARYCSPEEDDGDKEKKETTTSSSSADGAGRGDGTTSGATTDGATTTTTGVSRPLSAKESLPRRVVVQLEGCSYSQLARFVQRTSKELLVLKRSGEGLNGSATVGAGHADGAVDDEGDALRSVLERMVLGVRSVARSLLLSSVTCIGRQERWANVTFYGSVSNGKDLSIGADDDDDDNGGGTAATDKGAVAGREKGIIEHTQEYNFLVCLVRRACWRTMEREQLSRLVEHLISIPLKESTPSRIVLRMELVLALRRVILDKYACDVRGMDPFPIRDPDLSTVLLEMIGVSNEEVSDFFNVGKRECARAIHVRIQRIVRSEAPPSSLFKPAQSYDMDEDDVSAKEKTMQYGNGMFFSSSVFLEQILILTTGSGLFSSSSMTALEMKVVSTAMLIAFIWNGGVNAAIGRTSSFYMFQWSFSLATVSAVERITGGLLVSMPVALIGGVVAGVLEKSLSGGLLFFCFFILFFYYLMMVSALVSIRIKSVWQSGGGRAIFTSYAILAMPAVATATGTLAFASSSGTLAWFYVAALLAADVQMTVNFHYICIARCKCFEGVHVVTDADLNQWAYDNLPSLYDDGKGSSNFGKVAGKKMDDLSAKKLDAKRRYLIRTSYARAVREALRHRSQLFRSCCGLCRDACSGVGKGLTQRAESWLVKRRARHFGKEALLLKWYLLQASQIEPSPLSSEWESSVSEALAAMRMKRMTDVGLRPGLLYEFEGPEMVYGWLYFVLIFVDRLAYVFSGEGVFLFGAEIQNSYTQGMGWATIFLLLCTGVLEVAMNRLQTFQNKFTGMRMGQKGDTKEMMSERILKRVALYKRETQLLFLRMLGFWLFMTIIVIASTYHLPIDFKHPFVPYFIGCLGYVGLVFALFNKLYMGTKIVAAVKLIALSIFRLAFYFFLMLLVFCFG